METSRRTTCRVCEAACGLLADVEDGQVVALRPDPAHPVSRGYACRKGTTFHDRVQRHPDRVLRPRLRDGDRWTEVSWDQALASVGGRLRAIAAAHGPGAIGLYSGNAAGHALGAVLGVAALQRAFGTVRHYSCLTLDNSGMFVVAEKVFGHPLATFVADYAGSDLVVLFGTDPLSSEASQAQSHPRATADLRERARAGQFVVVDPRRSDTARIGTHLAPRVGTDVFVLAWLLGELTDEVALREATAPFELSRVARVSGLAPDALIALRDRLRAAERPLVWSGLGVLLGPHGTLGWWLTVALQAAVRGLDRRGGWRWQPGAVDLPRWTGWLGLDRYGATRSPVDGRPSILGTLPAATLADDDGLRALVVIGGDPASSLPDSARAQQRLASLELLVTIDLFAGPIGQLAHAVLPATTWLERTESGLQNANQRAVRHLRVDAPVVPPRGEARDELSIALALCRAAGVRPFASPVGGWVGRLGVGGITRLLQLVPVWPSPPPRANVVVDEWCAALRGLADPEPGLRLLTTVRPRTAMNHWLRGEAPAVLVHPEDAPAGPATLVGPAGELSVALAHDPGLARGTIVFPFGHPGGNPNALIGGDALDPYTGQPVANGTRVDVRIG